MWKVDRIKSSGVDSLMSLIITFLQSACKFRFPFIIFIMYSQTAMSCWGGAAPESWIKLLH